MVSEPIRHMEVEHQESSQSTEINPKEDLAWTQEKVTSVCEDITVQHVRHTFK